MKKSVIVMLFISIILCLTVTSVFADTAPISLEGKTSVTPGETGTVNVKISSNDTIGVVSGYIKYDSNLTNIQVSGKNNWTVTYNSETGKFNVVKPEGAKSEEIIEIKYTSSNAEGTGTITLSNLQVTNINYDTEDVSDIAKTISIKNSIPDNPVEEPSDKPSDKPAEEPADKPADKPAEEPTKKPVANPSQEPSNSNSLTTAAKTLPKAGVMTKVILPISIVLVSIVSVGVYLGYRKYKGIK